MGRLTREEALRIEDEHVREAALADVDLNDFCGACYSASFGQSEHAACSGDSGDPRHSGGTTDKCMCACARAKALRGET